MLQTRGDTQSTFSVVLLPGAEALVEEPTAVRMREGPHLNTSICAFETVVNALSASPNAAAQAPFDSSKLTSLLKDALGGNCRTSVLVTLFASSTPATARVLTLASKLTSVRDETR